MEPTKMVPIQMMSRSGRKRTLSDAETAFAILVSFWPKEFAKSELRAVAINSGEALFRDAATPEQFRADFVEAAAEADILALEHEPEPLLNRFMAKQAER
jgi:hypothetical protein